ncbi:MAG: hypothetical protein K0S61_3407 [Anaerocolumna sp.]|jgi:hypothetical protein|nr:hypothetical protein [Anaerocolumna sp.]
MIVLAPLVMGFSNLNQLQVAKILELYLSFIGMILLVPIFIPDMNHDIRDLIRSKREAMPVIHLLRTIEAVAVIVIIGVSFLLLLKKENCIFSFGNMLYTLLANGFFLGGLGMLMFSLSDQVVFAYMIPLIYYVVNYGGLGRRLNMFYLFSMQMNQITPKLYLMVSGILFIIGSIVIVKWKTIRKH